jgi:hypothetical protein
MRSVAGNKRSRTVDDGRAELNVEEHQMAPGRSAPGAKEGRIPSPMRTWRVHEFGTPQVMKFERVPRPEPGPREVLVKYGAAGVGPWDGWIRAGTSAVPPGEVVSVGPGVSKLRVGEPVFGVAPAYRGLRRIQSGFRRNGFVQADLANAW